MGNRTNLILGVVVALGIVRNGWGQERAPTSQIATGGAGESLTPEQHQAKFDYTCIQPLLDVPMIDAAITRGPDGMYYLTGTKGTKRTDGTVDFAVNDGVQLWKSSDLKKWDDLGLVVPRSLIRAKVADLGLLRTASDPDEMKGLLAPELHFVKGRCYLTYSLKPCGTGLLKSKTGKPEGPYEDVGLITKDGTDASLFADDDGKVYWVFGGGWIAPMNEALTALAESPRLIQPQDARKDLSPGAQILQVGTGGAFLFKKEGIYHLLAAGIHGRLGVPCYDTWVSTAKSLAGPWSRRKLAVAHGGQATMFEGPDQQWYATFSGVDSRAAVRERAAIVPVDWVEASSGYWVSKGEPWPWKKPEVITEAWGWEHARPLSELSFRDPMAVNGRDGYFYASGLHNYRSLGKRTCILKGKDLTGATPWEATPIAGYETVDKMPWCTPQAKPGSFIIGACKLLSTKSDFWISIGLYGGWGGKRVLRSESGTMNGPWKVAIEPPQPEPPGAGYWGGMPVEDYQSNLYGQGMVLWPMTADFSAVDKKRVPPTEPGYQSRFDDRLCGYTQESSDGSCLHRGDAPAGWIFKVDGKYLMAGGAGWHGEYRTFGTYDCEIFWAHEIGGPWHPNRSVLPHGGNSGLFQDNNGGWWHISFANDSFLPDMSRLRCLPLEIKWSGNGYDIRPKHKPETPFLYHPPVRTVDAVAVAQTKPAYPVMKLPADIPLQDPAITPVTEGGQTVYYLTGTAGEKRPDGARDFRNNDGVYLWKSSDAKSWTPLGRVFDLTALNRLPKGVHAGSWNNPLLVYFSPPDSLEPTYDRGIITPKLYRLGQDYWIVFSASRQQVGLLKSKTGKPEGPYDLVGPQTVHDSTAGILDSGTPAESRSDAYMFAYDPSFYIEGDAVYLVFGPGWIARMQDDLGQGLAEKPRRLEVEGQLYAGQGGGQIFKQDGIYHLLAATEWGDVVEMTSKSVYGPYANRRLILPQSGPVTIFNGADGQWHGVATMSDQKQFTQPTQGVQR